MKNSYPEKPEVECKFGSKEMGSIIDAIKNIDAIPQLKRVAYVVARNESSNGKSIINGTNICGAQGDSGRWPSKFDQHITATCVKRENKRADGSGGDIRRFIVFDSLESCITFLCDRLQSKGVYIGSLGGKYHKQPVTTVEQLADAYQDEWVFGQDHNTKPIEANPFISMYNQAVKLFP